MIKKILIIGGTGIVGEPLAEELLRAGYEVEIIALKKSEHLSNLGINQIIVDRYSDQYLSEINNFNKRDFEWEAIIDICAYDKSGTEQTYKLFKDKAKQIFIFSTTLVYDRSNLESEPINENNQLARVGEYGGYVDGKLEIESFWSKINDVNWTILRPYHILGKWSLLGYVPNHNRDPQLIELIKNDSPLDLVNGGEISFNYIHPFDLAKILLGMIGNDKVFKQTYNTVNPLVIKALDYYETIGKELGKEIKVNLISMDQVWSGDYGWEMTTLPHIYNVDKLNKDVGFIPQITLEEAIKDAIQFSPFYDTPLNQIPVHKNMNKLPRPKRPDWL